MIHGTVSVSAMFINVGMGRTPQQQPSKHVAPGALLLDLSSGSDHQHRDILRQLGMLPSSPLRLDLVCGMLLSIHRVVRLLQILSARHAYTEIFKVHALYYVERA